MSGELPRQSTLRDEFERRGTIPEPEPMEGVMGLLQSAQNLARDVPDREVIVLCACAIVGELAAIRAAVGNPMSGLPHQSAHDDAAGRVEVCAVIHAMGKSLGVQRGAPVDGARCYSANIFGVRSCL